ncbi:uncharacterized protein BDW70DRAFT_75527 [Aspergillus foveolatus]|uniref:uncharacterized protein n=1 Tax=Aspergillus foveolatus TaxID=210207 RepID=UPI003CCCF60B
MSGQPMPPAPPYWGANYTQQWTPQPAPSSGSMPHDLQFNPDPSFDPQQYRNIHNFYANSNLSGLGGASATGTFPPPPFAFPSTFPPAPSAPPFATMPNVGYPLMPLSSVHSQMRPNQPSTNDMDNSARKTPGQHPTSTTKSNQDLDREEGELTDIEGPATTEQQPHSQKNARRPRGHVSDSQPTRRAGSEGDNRPPIGQSQSTRSNGLHAQDERSAVISTGCELLSDLEEGEASPERRASSRASGSPYNPPMPTNAISPPMSKLSPDVLKTNSKEVGTVERSVSASSSKSSPESAVSVAQLRVQAQGALLSLAPHSIRYTELVGEGINPTILKQLYEEVGIKVPITPPDDARTRSSSKETADARTDQSAANGQAKQPAKQNEPQQTAAPTATPSEPSSVPPQTAPARTTKPMERKEVIARMLAAKAAKSSPASAPPTDAAQTAGPVQSTLATVEKSTLSTPSQDQSANEKETRLREKNKAQTELARQRIELLKKQGLIRNLQKSQINVDKEQRNAHESPQPQPSTIKQHPLPERPPLPESASLDHIPGLFMMDQAPPTNGAHTTVQDPVSDSAAHPRSSQRKRPRASDFDDDPIPVPKKAFTNGTNHQIPPERLIIDISDDEFYDDDEGSMDVETSTGLSKGSGPPVVEGLPRAYPPPAGNLPHRPATSQSYSSSAVSTPGNHKSNEQDDLRKKDLEIQAMHRRIAELEQRKKAKLASRTQSPRASDLSSPDIVGTPAAPAPSSFPTLPSATDKKAEDLLAAMNADGLRQMKSKILRMQEIEAGVPSLDAVIRKTEMKLADARREVEELSSELAKGEEGRQQLIEELNALKLEVAGLSLDHVNSALSTIEAKKDLPDEAVQAPTSENEVADNLATAVPEVPEADASTNKNTAPPSHTDPTAKNSPPVKDRPIAPNTVEDAPNLNATAEELTDTSMSDSSSSMDESSADSSSESGSLNEEMPDAPEPNTNPIAPVDELNTISPGPSIEPERLQAKEEPLPGDQASNLQTSTNKDLGVNSENLASRESPVSEAYEPPEPEESANASDSNYSPAPSPGFHSPAPNMEVPGPSEDQSKEAGEPLTKKVQELDFQQPSQHSQIGPLDNSRRPEDSHRKLTPYFSPLKLFRAYRYHPNYNDEVSGGYRSLTYSHNIDPLKHLCPFETSGGVCNDRSCEFQHFRNMALSDDKILIQMGSLREGKTAEESDKYVAGLKEAINDMRRDKVKDFNTVAAEIVAYRRRFLQDPTRVLAL